MARNWSHKSPQGTEHSHHTFSRCLEWNRILTMGASGKHKKYECKAGGDDIKNSHLNSSSKNSLIPPGGQTLLDFTFIWVHGLLTDAFDLMGERWERRAPSACLASTASWPFIWSFRESGRKCSAGELKMSVHDLAGIGDGLNLKCPHRFKSGTLVP